ncbi:DUF3870 domain-containing protein [Actinoalloteichus hymeniacidonis]|uniref:DUF3870 family protein n=1 Tax=Actinoalloteichus hymeniacidonis TaxID=340345 RepID=A0AAC9HUS2_9PSEU|nr:DUF3870 domain-containing protein [Actinoalloteichus hymeniacidonis]AOS65917.1 putative DUF3870 family protein [Actinoalloteichus hymeniacidonis]MBB5905987.1 hypothetical protein [Actinoalloteichus hymeniacidonis]
MSEQRLSDRLRQALADGDDLFLTSGYARLPDSVAGHSQYERIGVVLVVDRRTGRIAAADTTLLTGLGTEFFRALVENRSLFADPAGILDTVRDRYHGQSGPALLTALKRCLENCVHLAAAAERPGDDGD